MRRLMPFVLAGALGACASSPVIYPNAHMQSAGKDQANADIKECGDLAKKHMKDPKASGVAGKTVEGGVVGAAAGAAGGAIFGGVARSAAGGSVTGAAVGLVHGLFHVREPSPARKQFVTRCLADKGYDVVGWE